MLLIKLLQILLDTVNKGLNNAKFLYNGEIHQPDENLENLNKKKGQKKGTNEDIKPIQVSIFQSLVIFLFVYFLKIAIKSFLFRLNMKMMLNYSMPVDKLDQQDKLLQKFG